MNIAIIGLGNIGGSFAKSIRASFPNYKIYAIDIDTVTLDKAQSIGLIDGGSDDFTAIIPKADLIIFSVYPTLLKNLVESYVPYFKNGVVITDVTGVKSSVINQIEPLLPKSADFIFGHPMAGRENRGLEFSSREVFIGANYLITPTSRNLEENIDFLKNFVKQLGFGNISVITPDFHDEVIGFTSQLAHVIAISLINSDDTNRNTKQYTGDSYRDLTRITNINEKLWPELFMMNKDHLIKHIDNFKVQLDKLTQAIENDDVSTMENMMVESTKRYMDLHDLNEE
ncbi:MULTISPECIES: prephenate dehydrogenase [Jeotgalicoccus]|jgi:prephenate dehydrogenase|uniref:prephenate dehydrogenase n=1 Tax=Jeotgalicoccus TaxID=227979 RepID=UPI0003FB2231|nr:MULTISPECIES: prephenate dehydrogenase [Jeotgalicoccus]QQD84307.1 prephenate dehydrogenase [Jeotgalicoccus sp. ATCC 8456]